MTKAVNIEAIEQTTKITWKEWLKFLDGINAKNLEHKAIAEKVHEKLKDELDNAGWWAQSVTVAYEQETGRRKPGQRSDGSFEPAVSKTIHGSMNDAMNVWLKAINNKTEFNGAKLVGEPSQTQTKGNSHWACNLDDGSRLTVDAYKKDDTKVGLTITMRKVKSQDAADNWKTYWKEFLAKLPA